MMNALALPSLSRVDGDPMEAPGASVAVLYARADSVYKGMAREVFDLERDARTYRGPYPVVCHPPCRAWGRLRAFAKPRHDEKDLVFHALAMVRQWGGVLEHPAASSFWPAADLPRPGCRDAFGLTLVVDQQWFGHRAPKRTFLYVCGASVIPAIPFHLGDVIGRVELMDRREREATPLAFASWLLDLAGRCRV